MARHGLQDRTQFAHYKMLGSIAMTLHWHSWYHLQNVNCDLTETVVGSRLKHSELVTYDSF